ncbi:SpoIIE family protein phosphatase [Thalassotalea euphylliae]|uniref:Response regulator n=1 Tax=Thalassotalea euphylliae TaxID=1655234 RepID=A0A3E0ULC5_9GAMM|nr:SpoIIE family protein phosphatase [Thalassotalea euphylliae]REL36532.1 response regulator [Thalassotalea euphylliae]
MMDTLLLTLTRPASLNEIKTIRDAATNVLTKCGVDSADVNKAKLVISEWATNIVKHAIEPATFIQLMVSQAKLLPLVNADGDGNDEASSQRITISLQDNSSYFDEFNQCQMRVNGLSKSNPTTPSEDGEPNANTQQASLSFGESGMGLGIIFNLFADCKYQRRLRAGAQTFSKLPTQDYGDNAPEVNRFSFSLQYQTRSQANVRIAVVEDEPMMRELIKGYLPSHYEVTVFNDGLAFLEHLEQNSITDVNQQSSEQSALHSRPHSRPQSGVYDLVISDISMPNLDGLNLKKRLAANPKLSHIPFIFLTAQDDFDVEMQANHLGIDNYLIKPVQKEKLRLSVERALIRHQQLEAEKTARLNRSLDNTLNQALKPEVSDSICGYQIHARSFSPKTGGGDFIYQQAIGDKTLLILADVMGHDAQAKLFAHSFSGFFSGFLSGLSLNTQQFSQAKCFDLTAMMTALSNKLFEDELLSCSMFTYLALLIDEQGVEIASAGHPQPLLLTASSNADMPIYEVLNVQGALAGVCIGIEYQSTYLSMQPGQQLLLFTDGLTDCLPKDMKPNAYFDQLLSLKSAYQCHSYGAFLPEFEIASKHCSAQAFIELSFEHFLTLCPKPNDDVTLLLLTKS